MDMREQTIRNVDGTPQYKSLLKRWLCCNSDHNAVIPRSGSDEGPARLAPPAMSNVQVPRATRKTALGMTHQRVFQQPGQAPITLWKAEAGITLLELLVSMT